MPGGPKYYQQSAPLAIAWFGTPQTPHHRGYFLKQAGELRPGED